jgi:endonuclease/exonuclease/phosphatase family metal-dependent hydrolase
MTRRVLRATLRRSLLRSVAVASVMAALLTGAVATPAYASHREPSLRVMTRNLFLGADLSRAVGATTPRAFLDEVAVVYAAKEATDFGARAKAIAQEIDRTGPDLVGLQEVSGWQTSGPATVAPSQDFLAVLQAALAARGLDYRVASTSINAVIGPVPLVSPCASTTVGACQLTFTDRDVILVNHDTRRLRWTNPQSGTYAAQLVFTPPLPKAPTLSFRRGWASIDGKFRGRPFHFVTTHLETSGSEDLAAIQQAQAVELLAGPAFGPGADLVGGDFNSAADGSTTKTYELLTDRLRDAWSVRRRAPGHTCCQEATLTNPAPQFSRRIDLILVHGAKPLAARRVGIRPIATTQPRWASDHAGVVADVRLAKKRLS